MDGFLRQSTAITIRIGRFLDSTDGNTEKTALTISQADIRLSKAGGAFAQKNDSTSCTHDERGYYSCSLDATDTNTVGMLKLSVHVTGALDVWHTWMVVPANVWDSLFGGTDRLQVHTDEITAGLITATTIADNAIQAAKIATGAITNAKFAAGAIDAAAIATDAIGASEFAQAAADKVWSTATRALTDKAGFTISGTKTTLDALNDITAASVWNVATRTLTDKADFALSAASRAAIWDEIGSLSLSFETLIQRTYQMINNKMTVNESSGAVVLRNIGDTSDIATGSVVSSSGTTTRAELAWT